jgi:hypothetical protein
MASFRVDVEWDERSGAAAATLHQDGAPPRLYTAGDPRAAAREACDAALRGTARPSRPAGSAAETDPLRRALLWTAIASLSLSAVIAIATFLGGDLEDDWQVPVSTLAVTLYSLTAGGAAALLSRTPDSLLARAGVAVSLIAGVLALIIIWSDHPDDNDGLVNTWAIATVLAIACAQVALLLGRARDDDGDPVRITLVATVVAVTAVAVLFSAAILNDFRGGDGWARLLGSLLVLDALGTVLLPILRKLQD